MKTNKMSRWKNYKIQYEFKNTEGKEKDIQMLLYMNDELVYTSRKNCFKKKNIKTTKLTFNKWHLPYYVPIEKSILIWSNDKEHNRFLNFCKRFKYTTCFNLQDELKIKQCSYEK